MMKKSDIITRTLEIIPGFISWGILLFVFMLAVLHPIACAVLIIIFDFYWIIRTIYLTVLLVIAHKELSKHKDKDWLSICQNLSARFGWQKIYHVIIFPVSKEGPEILRPSLEAIKQCHYPKDKIIVVLSFEKRNPKSAENAAVIENEFKNCFLGYIVTFHPDKIPGETRTKGANATWAAKKARQFIDLKGILHENVIISCFDSDTCVEKEYFGCLTYHFLNNSKPHQTSYQPIPVYNNNIWYAPSFARIVEISSSFCQLIESMRLEKFVTFSSHSMSFKTLVELDYWPVDMISDDSVVYWKAYLYYKGDYTVLPLYITVSMDVAYASNLFKTVWMQYKQKRRWAWGVENFPYVVSRFLTDKEIPLRKKIIRSYHLLESHITWAIWAVMITVMSSLPIIFGGAFFAQIPIGYNLPRVTGLLFHFTLGASIVWILLSRTILPPRPADVKWSKNITMILEWVLVPFIIMILGSTPALDAQTRLMFRKDMEFYVTEKRRE